ncbi:MAG: hypothetical protein SGJ10_04000 [Bacteroidota bacterium]|nr:hypothetical protein [Bacteroidota bacterium]
MNSIYFIGINIGRTSSEAFIFDKNGNIILHLNECLEIEWDPKQKLYIMKMVDGSIQKCGTDCKIIK